ncbi:MAG: rhomboid family intramembrane serine protease [Deltaproteobacteria bacterium]|nr:MAG: rhomboid family intramembrane serine protease [Deltaproteobacteria bacterium]
MGVDGTADSTPIGPCPACGLARLEPRHVTSDGTAVAIDVCPVCEGAFFDAGELDAVRSDDAPLEALFGLPRIPRVPRLCPRGHGPMEERRPQVAGITCTADVCRTCHGVFLDGRERRLLAKGSLPPSPPIGQVVARRSVLWILQLLVHLPVEVRNPTRGRAWVVLSLVVSSLALFVARIEGVDLGHLALDPAAFHTPSPPLPTLVTYALVHGSWWHVLGNVYFLYTFGDNVEHVFGSRLFALFAVLVTAAGAVAFLATEPADGARLVGASGLVAGILAAYLWTFPRNRLFHVVLFVQFELPAWIYVALWATFQVGMAFAASEGSLAGADADVAWSVHVGSFVAGLVLTPLAHLRVRHRLARAAAGAATPSPTAR